MYYDVISAAMTRSPSCLLLSAFALACSACGGGTSAGTGVSATSESASVSEQDEDQTSIPADSIGARFLFSEEATSAAGDNVDGDQDLQIEVEPTGPDLLVIVTHDNIDPTRDYEMIDSRSGTPQDTLDSLGASPGDAQFRSETSTTAFAMIGRGAAGELHLELMQGVWSAELQEVESATAESIVGTWYLPESPPFEFNADRSFVGLGSDERAGMWDIDGEGSLRFEDDDFLEGRAWVVDHAVFGRLLILVRDQSSSVMVFSADREVCLEQSGTREGLEPSTDSC